MRSTRHDGELDAPIRALVALSAALAAGDEEGVERALSAADSLGLDAEVEECLLQSHLFVGFARSLNGFASWRALRRGHASPVEVEEGRELWAERGEALCREVYGSAYESLRDNIHGLHPDMDRWMVEEGYGKVLGRPGLPTTVRELCIVAILSVQDVAPQLYSHLRGALRVGCTGTQVEAALAVALRGCEDPVRRKALAQWDRVRSRRESGEDIEPSGSVNHNAVQ